MTHSVACDKVSTAISPDATITVILYTKVIDENVCELKLVRKEHVIVYRAWPVNM